MMLIVLYYDSWCLDCIKIDADGEISVNNALGVMQAAEKVVYIQHTFCDIKNSISG